MTIKIPPRVHTVRILGRTSTVIRFLDIRKRIIKTLTGAARSLIPYDAAFIETETDVETEFV